MEWLAIGASVPGTSHLARNTPCQDFTLFRVLKRNPDWFVIVMADGAGSAAHSDIGAKLVCEYLLEQIDQQDMAESNTEKGLIQLVRNAREVLIQESSRLQTKPRELACTLMITLIGPDSATFAQLGDGAIVYEEESTFKVAFWPEQLEYANSSHFLTDDSFEKRIQFASISTQSKSVAVFTDGLQRIALDYSTQLPFEAFFRPFFKELEKCEDVSLLQEPLRIFLDSERINQRTDDDKTLVLALRK